MQYSFLEVNDLENGRDCIRDRSDELAYAQQSKWWQKNSFIAWIAACQDDWST